MKACEQCGTELFRIQGRDRMENVAQEHSTARCNDVLIAKLKVMAIERDEWKESREFQAQMNVQLNEQLIAAKKEVDRLQDECVLLLDAEDERDKLKALLVTAEENVAWMQPVLAAAVKWRRNGGMAYKAVFEAVEAALKKKPLPAPRETTP